MLVVPPTDKHNTMATSSGNAFMWQLYSTVNCGSVNIELYIRIKMNVELYRGQMTIRIITMCIKKF